MGNLASQAVEIFRAGDYGDKGKYSHADLDLIASSYDPALFEAPATLGHEPKSGDPAGAWVKAVERKGDVLVATFANVDPAFELMVKDRRFPHRSAGIGKHPETGKPYLHHVAFLGAKAPHIKGLKPIQFTDDQSAVTEIDFQEGSMPDLQEKDRESIVNSLFDKLRGVFGSKHEPAAATATFSEADLKKAVDTALTEGFADKNSQLGKLVTNFEDSQVKAATAASKQRSADAVLKLKQKGRWVPAFEKAGLVAVFDELAKTEPVVTFGEGNDKKEKSPLDALVQIFEELPQIVPAAQVYSGQQSAAQTPAKAAGVNDTSRAPADPNSMQLDSLAKARASEKNISYGDALGQVASEKPELTRPGGATGGQV